ncbi:MAG: ABC-type glycerol-3-phosphate transport system substrate-binding protein [Candidatus Paceibacteria bacterium]|jgi:ABC-type glycerol-3-phosphate transport system substrate-binding protein
MADKKNTFQITLLVVFGAAILIAVIMFSVTSGSGGASTSKIVLWGIFPKETVFDSLERINDDSKSTGVSIQYVEKDPLTYEGDLVEAFASGTGPDLFFIDQNMILAYENKIRSLPYESFPERDYKLKYIDGATVFLGDDGVLAFPFAVDPLVMYYNKSIFNTAGVSVPPKDWSQFAGLVPLLTQKDSNQNIIKSGLAFGQFSNIQYASSIFETLLLQLGNPIIARRESGEYVSVISQSNSAATNPLALSIQFFTNFSNPLLDTYSWNSALQSAEDMFVQDRLAIYFAPASRFFDIQRKNINLNYDITKVPQVSQSSNFLTSGDFYGIAVAKSSLNQQAAFAVSNNLSNGPENDAINKNNFLAPVRRDSLQKSSSLTPYESAIRESAIISYTWLNPGTENTEGLFKEAIDSVVRGSMDESAASNLLNARLGLLLGIFNDR